MKEIIRKVTEGHDLSREEASYAMRKIMEGSASDAQIAGLLIGLKMKGEHPGELLGFTEVMREKSVKVKVDDPDAVDTCGTGGDGTGTFNISTIAAFAVAGAGVTVAKHGNRSISSSCGSADVLLALGVNIGLGPEKVSACINTIGIGFLFAPIFHPAMRFAAKPRSELGVKTAFNLLGPMTNPAGVRRQLVGAFSVAAARKMAAVLASFQPAKVFVVSSHDGLDEISLESPTVIFDVNDRDLVPFDVTPETFGVPRIPVSSVAGGSIQANAEIALRILRGELNPHRHYVTINAGFALMAAGKAGSIQDGIKLAEESINSGRALQKLEALREFSNR